MRRNSLACLSLLLSLGSSSLNAEDQVTPAPAAGAAELVQAPAQTPAQVPEAPAQTVTGSVNLSAREAKSGKVWGAKKISYRFELAGGGEVKGALQGSGIPAPLAVPQGIHQLHITVGERVIPPARVLITPHALSKVEFLVGGGGRVDVRQTFEFGQIAFESSKALLLEESRARLENVAALLKKHPAIKRLSIEGFTDSSGNAQKNTELSAQRAATVYEFLEGQEIKSDRLEHHGYGAERPLVDNATPAGRAVNRRVEFAVKELGEKDEEAAPAALAPIADVIKDSAESLVEAVTYPWIFVGVDYGRAHVQTDEPLELDKDGSYVSAKALIDFYFPQMTVEGGGGIFNTTFPAKSEGNIIGESASIQTLFIQGSVRYPTTFGLEIGVVSHILFGAANDFGPVSDGKHENYFMGLEAIYQPANFKNLRVALDFLQDYTINTRDVNILTFGLQYGLEVNERESLFSKVASTPPAAVAPVIPEVKAEEPAPPPPPPTLPGAAVFTAREAGSGKKWAGKAIAYTVTQSGREPVAGEFSDGGPTAPLSLPPGRHSLNVKVGDKAATLDFIVQSEATVKVEVLAAAGRIDLRQLMDIGEIKFESNNDIILPESETKLVGLAATLQATPSIKLLSVEGFTDSSGNATKNLDLSRRRAESVVRFLVEKGVDKNRLESHGFGAQRPLVDNATPAGRAVNRRVEFVIKELNSAEEQKPTP